MPIFKVSGYKLAKVQEKQIKRESHIQKLTEINLKALFGLEFVSGRITREMAFAGFRIDTLAYDPIERTFVIIEYKRNTSCSVIDQGYAYLALMLDYKAEFILEYNERTGARLKRRDIKWSKSRVIFVARRFNIYQRSAISMKDVPIELWEVKVFNNRTVRYNQLKACNSKRLSVGII